MMMSDHKTIYWLGCAWSQIPLAFDIAYETFGTRDFRILKNIKQEEEAGFEIDTNLFTYSVHEPGDKMPLNDFPLAFGVTGPKAKKAVFSFFQKKYNIQPENFINIIHPSSYMATSARLDHGIFIEPKVIISTQARIGFGVTIKRGASIGHNSEIGDLTEINPGVIISGFAKIGKGCILGVGSVIKNKVTIGENSFIGMGSVVTGNIPAGVIAYGNPCKVIRENDLWKI